MLYFVGAGPGDPELITVKGQRLLAEADVVIYTGSLINPAVLNWAQPAARLYNSSGLTLEEVLDLVRQAVKRGEKVVRLHTGDPSLYGAVREQMDALREEGIEFSVVPGVSSFLAAAAELQAEYTLPGVSQTVILTRLGGRTPVPELENLGRLAAHRASLCLFLSVQDMDQVVNQLLEGYPSKTPVAVVERASWPDQRVVHGTLADITGKVQEAGIRRTALVLVGDFLGDHYQRSRLYHPEFSHGFRRARPDG